MQQEEVRLEGFADSLKGSKLYCVGSPNRLPGLVQSRLAILDTEVAHRGRKILFLQEGRAEASWLLRMKWDAIFVIHDTLDLRLGLTYVSNTVKPARLVWVGGEPSQQVFAALAKVEGLTLVGFGTVAPKNADWTAIFWTHDSAYDTVESAVEMRLGQPATNKYNLRSVLREIQASEVGLVWSCIGDSDKRGSLYWFDPAEGAVGGQLYSSAEAAELLRSIADSIGAGR